MRPNQFSASRPHFRCRGRLVVGWVPRCIQLRPLGLRGSSLEMAGKAHWRSRRGLAGGMVAAAVLGSFALLVLGACSAEVVVPRSDSPSASVDPATMGFAVEFRILYGLRHDAPYLRSVAENPASAAGQREFGVPLLPAEVMELKARARNTVQVFSTVETYGERHPEDWAGLYVDNGGSGAVVAQFSGRVADHRSAILALVGPLARVEVVPVRWSTATLSRAADEIRAQRQWFQTIDASLVWAEVNERDNRVDVSLSSTNPEAVARTVERFRGDGWLRAVSDGIGEWTAGTGQLVVTLTDPLGRTLAGTDDEQWLCRLMPDDPAAWRGGPLVMVDGRCRSSEPLGATSYAVTVTRDDGSGEVTVASGTVLVPAHGTGELRLVAPAQSGSPDPVPASP
jgi:hypothetical protein